MRRARQAGATLTGTPAKRFSQCVPTGKPRGMRQRMSCFSAGPRREPTCWWPPRADSSGAVVHVRMAGPSVSGGARRLDPRCGHHVPVARSRRWPRRRVVARGAAFAKLRAEVLKSRGTRASERYRFRLFAVLAEEARRSVRVQRLAVIEVGAQGSRARPLVRAFDSSATFACRTALCASQIPTPGAQRLVSQWGTVLELPNQPLQRPHGDGDGPVEDCG